MTRMKNAELRMQERKSTIKTFRDLTAWQKGHLLVIEVYKITDNFPKSEVFALSSQMRRAAISITSNIAEGFSRDSIADKAHFYIMAHGSITELESQIIIAKDLGYIAPDRVNAVVLMADEVYRVIGGLIRSTKEKI